MTAVPQGIVVPAELQTVLREYTKEVLKGRPAELSELLLFSRDFFHEKAVESRLKNYKLPPSTSKPFQDLAKPQQLNIEEVFKRYDEDCDFSLTIVELQTMMSDLGGLFGFSHEVDASTLMALLDADGNQSIDWQEWSHACAVWLSDMS